MLERTFLFDGYAEYFESLIPKPGQPSHFDANFINPFPNVLTHNDAHQNNILMSLPDNRDLILIDFEYAGWNPMAMDIAVYINETMNDNSFPGRNGIKWYTDNIMSDYEQDLLINTYLARYFQLYMPSDQKAAEYNNNIELFLAKNFAPFKRQVLDCILLNNFFWGVWALSLLSKEDTLKPGIFNYDFAHSRCDMYNTFKETIM